MVQSAIAQTPTTDQNGAPVIAPGQTPTPELRARERAINQQNQQMMLQQRANERSTTGEQQFQQDRSQAQQRDNTIQQNFQQQQMDILNNRDK
jgi:hypothetical protein